MRPLYEKFFIKRSHRNRKWLPLAKSYSGPLIHTPSMYSYILQVCIPKKVSGKSAKIGSPYFQCASFFEFLSKWVKPPSKHYCFSVEFGLLWYWMERRTGPRLWLSGAALETRFAQFILFEFSLYDMLSSIKINKKPKILIIWIRKLTLFHFLSLKIGVEVIMALSVFYCSKSKISY